MEVKKLAILTAIISTILLVASFAVGYAIYQEVKAQIITEMNAAKENSP